MMGSRGFLKLDILRRVSDVVAMLIFLSWNGDSRVSQVWSQDYRFFEGGHGQSHVFAGHQHPLSLGTGHRVSPPRMVTRKPYAKNSRFFFGHSNPSFISRGVVQRPLSSTTWSESLDSDHGVIRVNNEGEWSSGPSL